MNSYRKVKYIQSSLKQVDTPETMTKLSKKFVEQMQKGNNNMENGILLLTDTTLKLLKQSHPKTAPSTEEVLVPDQPESIHHMKYENNNADAVCKAVLKTKGYGSSGMDADAWKRILTSKQFAESSADLCTSIANMTNMIKNLRIEKNLANSLKLSYPVVLFH